MQSENSVSSYINDDINLAHTLLAKDDLNGAIDILRPLLKKNPKKRFEVLQALIRANDMRLGKQNEPESKEAIHRENLGWLREQQRIRPRPFTLYRIGKRYLTLGKEEQALVYFRQAYAKAPHDSHYRGAAKTFIRRLE